MNESHECPAILSLQLSTHVEAECKYYLFKIPAALNSKSGKNTSEETASIIVWVVLRCITASYLF